MNQTGIKISKLLPIAVALGWFWLAVINHLRIEWTLNEQYTYGWAVPFLCLWLIWKRCEQLPPHLALSAANGESALPMRSGARSGSRDFPNTWSNLLLVLAAVFAFCYLPIRLIEEANPEWRLISWAFTLAAAGLTLTLIALSGGNGALGRIGFPLGFFLVAVPWPSVPEQTIIQGLTRFNASASAELMGLLGVPAIARGNLIEIATGVVGVEEACSGIRSIQATLMLALFFGGLYRLRAPKRLDLCVVGVLLSLGFNLARTSLLIWIASRKGIVAMSKWHDPASTMILLGCFTGLWLTAWKWKQTQAKAQNPKSKVEEIEVGGQKAECGGQSWREWLAGMSECVTAAGVNRFAVVVVVWFALSEMAVQAWYLTHERRLPPATPWVAEFPRDNPSYHEQPLAARTRQLLRNDAEVNAFWRAPDGTHWQGTFLRWNPGKAATYLARGHTPEVCLSAAGGDLKSQSDLKYVRVAGLELPVRFYRVAQGDNMLDVLYCLWEDRAQQRDFGTLLPDYSVRFAAVRAGHRLQGQRSLELAVRGYADAQEAEAALTRQFTNIIRPPPAKER